MGNPRVILWFRGSRGKKRQRAIPRGRCKRERVTKYNYVDGTKIVTDRLGDGSIRRVTYGKDQMTVSTTTPRGGTERVITPRPSPTPSET